MSVTRERSRASDVEGKGRALAILNEAGHDRVSVLKAIFLTASWRDHESSEAHWCSRPRNKDDKALDSRRLRLRPLRVVFLKFSTLVAPCAFADVAE